MSASRTHKNWLKAYMHFTRTSESPDAFHFWTGVGTIAAALRRRVWLDMKHFQWTPNFYIILVGPPGIAAKSSTLRLGTSLLEKVDGIHFGPQSMTWQALTQAMGEATEYVKYTDYDGVDQTVAMSAVTCAVPELGTFLKMDDEAMVNVLISLWDGQLETWSHKTKSSGNIDIKNPWLNMIACTTPTWLEQNFPAAAIGGGLTSRIMFIYGDKKRHLVAYPDEVVVDKQYFLERDDLINDLRRIALLSGAYRLSPDARKWGTDWYERLWSARPVDMVNDRYSGYIARKQTHIHKLGIVLAAAKRDQMVVEKEDLVEADRLLTSVEPHMIKVFESVGVVDESKHIANILAHVKAYQWVEGNSLYTMLRANISEKDYKNAIRIAVEQGLLSVEVKDGKRGLVLAKPKTAS